MHHVAATIQKEWRVARVEGKVHDIFYGKKPHMFLGTHSFQTDFFRGTGLANAFERKRAALFTANGDREVKFLAPVTKMNLRGKCQARVLLITDSNIYNLIPKSFAMKWVQPIHKVRGLHMSQGLDRCLVIKNAPPARDLVIDVAGPEAIGSASADRLVELVYTLQLLTGVVLGRPAEVAFMSSITYNNSRKEKSPGKVIRLSTHRWIPLATRILRVYASFLSLFFSLCK